MIRFFLPPTFYTDFNLMYLANDPIYISSGSGVLDLHEMDYPDNYRRQPVMLITQHTLKFFFFFFLIITLIII